MKMTGLENDREKSPLMKALHEVGLAHGVTMVVVAIPMKPDGGEVRSLLIDHKDDTAVDEMILRFTGAGVFLIKAANAAEAYANAKGLRDAE